MKVVILCGGRGLRMGELTEDAPKPLVEINHRPMLWHIMKIYEAYGFHEFILLLGYKGEKIKEYFMDYAWKNQSFTLDTATGQVELLGKTDDWKITFLDTGMDTMTGARLKMAQPYIGNETFMATYGDGLADINLDKLLCYHREKGRIATVTGVRKRSQYGILTVCDGIASAFEEKMRSDTIINGGFFVLEPSVFNYIDQDTQCVFEHKPMSELAADGQLAVYSHDGFWYACDTACDIARMNQLCREGKDSWRVW